MCVLRIDIQSQQNHDAAYLRATRTYVSLSYDLHLPWSMAVADTGQHAPNLFHVMSLLFYVSFLSISMRLSHVYT